MKNIIIIIATVLLGILKAAAQEYVVDPYHTVTIASNAVFRSSAEGVHEHYLGKINTDIEDLNTNTGSVVLAQKMIYDALANVNSALKDGLAVKNMTVTIADMTYYIKQSLEMAKSQPYLLTFASNIAAEMKQRAVTLVTDVSGFILKDDGNVLADFNGRDQLIRKVTLELQIIDGLAYSTWKAMYWAKERGILTSIDPYAGFINRDKSFVNQIIQNAKYLKQ